MSAHWPVVKRQFEDLNTFDSLLKLPTILIILFTKYYYSVNESITIFCE